MKLVNKLTNNQPPEIQSREWNIKSEYKHSGCVRQLCAANLMTKYGFCVIENMAAGLDPVSTILGY